MHRTTKTAIGASLCGFIALASAQVYPIMPLAGNPITSSTAATGISADGMTVFATETTAITPAGASIRWTLATGSTALGPGTAWSGTPNGSIIVGHGLSGAWKWTAATGAEPIPGMAFAFCISRDGVWIGGTADGQPAVWSAATGVLPIAGTPPVFGLSANGSVAVGGSFPAFRAINRVASPLAETSYARAISADGSVTVGQVRLNGVDYPCRFNTSGYTIFPAPGSGTGLVRGISADGTIVVGQSSEGACLWINGVYHTLRQHIFDTAGLSAIDWEFTLARGISDDGNVIVGEGNYLTNGAMRPRGWVVDLRSASNCGVVFRAQQVDRRVAAGEDFVLSCPYWMRTSATVRWHKDGQPLDDDQKFSGTDTASLLVRNAIEADAGGYSLEVTQPCSRISSPVATVTVAPPPTVIYVDAGAGAGGVGTAWGSAFSSLTTALASAPLGSEIWVRAGTYRPDDVASAKFTIPTGVTVRGGFSGTESSAQERVPSFIASTILSGDQPLYDNSMIVSVTGGTCVLDRLVIQDARTYSSGYIPGGGCEVRSGTVTLTDCVLRNNEIHSGTTGGAGLRVVDGTVSLLRSTIESNRLLGNASLEGVGIAVRTGSLTLIECSMENNIARAISPGCIMGSSRGRVGGSGAAIHASAAYVVLRDSVFRDNTGGPGTDARFCANGYGGAFAGGHGGALFLSTCTSEISRCAFINNHAGAGGDTIEAAGDPWTGRAGGKGGAIYVVQNIGLTLNDCLFQGNTAGNGNAGGDGYLGGTGRGGPGGDAGAVYVTTGTVRIQNCTFVDNAAGSAGAGTLPGVQGTSAAIFTGTNESPISIMNCVFTGNRSGGGLLDGSVDRPDLIRSSLVQSDASPANRTFTAHAFFADPIGADGLPATGDEDFSPRADSPLIDAGDNSVVTSLFDLAGNSRINDDPATPDSGVGTGPFVDLGAFEYQPGTNCPADVNDDGETDTDDTTAFFGAWDQGHHSGDIDQDGDTDSDDIIYFFARFEMGC